MGYVRYVLQFRIIALVTKRQKPVWRSISFTSSVCNFTKNEILLKMFPKFRDGANGSMSQITPCVSTHNYRKDKKSHVKKMAH